MGLKLWGRSLRQAAIPIGALALLVAGGIIAATGDSIADRVLGQPDFTSANAATTQTGLYYPTGVAVDRSVTPNRLYVADRSNHRVMAWADVTAFANGGQADLVIGQPDFTSRNCPGPSPTSLCDPFDVAVDDAGNLYVSDTSYRRVTHYAAPFANDVVADGVYGAPALNTYGNCNVTATDLCYPYGLAISASGMLYVADRDRWRVLGFQTQSDATADLVLGQPDFTTSNYGCSNPGAGHFCYATDVAVDGAGNVYVADTDNARVLQYDDPIATDTTADRVFGQPNISTRYCNYNGISERSLCYPSGVAVDSGGRLYIKDYNNNRVLEYDAPLASDGSADQVFGQPDMVSSNGCNYNGISAASLCYPWGTLATDAAGNLYVPDHNNHRVLVYDLPVQRDYGDAPETGTNYPTTRARDGARHQFGGLQLGALRDFELDGQSNAAATGDDLFELADEDGVTFGPLVIGAATTLDVSVVGGDGLLDVWMDHNCNGDWDDEDDKVIGAEPVAEGSNTLPFTVPGDGVPCNGYARVRLSTEGSELPTGIALNGEVEDYAINHILPSVSIGDVTLVEGDGGATAFIFPVSLTHDVTQDVTVECATDNDTATTSSGDYLANAQTVLIPGAGSTTVQSFVVQVPGDSRAESNERFFVRCTSSFGAALADAEGEGVILDDDSNPGGPDLGTTLTVNDSNDDPVSFTTNQGTLVNLMAVAAPAGAPTGLIYPNGFFSYQIIGLNKGQSVSLEIELPAGSAPQIVIKCNNQGCGPFPSFISGDTVTLNLTDGGAGDSDGMADGTITDPVAPAQSPASQPGPEGPSGPEGPEGPGGPAGAKGAEGEEGGGCSVSRGPTRLDPLFPLLLLIAAHRLLHSARGTRRAVSAGCE